MSVGTTQRRRSRKGRFKKTRRTREARGTSSATSASNVSKQRSQILPEEEGSLTAREREILRLFADGLGTETIARRLSIARVTVRNHAQRILSKLGVHSRLAAVAHGYREGLI